MQQAQQPQRVYNVGPSKNILQGRFTPGEEITVPVPGSDGVAQKIVLTKRQAEALNYEYLQQVRAAIRTDPHVPEYRKKYPHGVFTPNSASKKTITDGGALALHRQIRQGAHLINTRRSTAER